MIGRRHPYYPYLEAALEAASLARGIHLYYLEKGFTEGTKSGPTDLVTQADREAEEAVKGLLLSRFPEAGFLGRKGERGREGPPLHRGPAGRDGELRPRLPLLRRIHRPPGRERHPDGRGDGHRPGGGLLRPEGEGAYLNGRPIRVTGRESLVGSLLATGFPYDVAKDPENLTYFERALRKGLLVRRPGAAALDLAYVAAGRLEGFWEVKLNPWDVAAGWLLVEEAGGRVTDLEGNPYRLGSRYILATNGRVHEALRRTLLGLD